MIRINLIGGAPGQAPQRAAMDMAQRVTVACSVILVVTIVVIGWRYWSLRQEAVQVPRRLGRGLWRPGSGGARAGNGTWFCGCCAASRWRWSRVKSG